MEPKVNETYIDLTEGGGQKQRTVMQSERSLSTLLTVVINFVLLVVIVVMVAVVKLGRRSTELMHFKTPWPQSASELYRQSGRRRSAKLVPTFCGQRGVTWPAQRIPTAVNLCFLDRSSYFFSSSSSVDLTRLSGPRSRPTTTQKIWQRRESNPRPLYLQPKTLTTEAVELTHLGDKFVIDSETVLDVK